MLAASLCLSLVALEPAPDTSQPDAAAKGSEPAAKPEAANYRLTQERPGPPWYSAEDESTLRARYGIKMETVPQRKASWRCLIADPTCGFSLELAATSAYAYRVRQSSTDTNAVDGWHSGRAQYDLWLNIPVWVETVGSQRFSRITMGPKGGIIGSDSSDLWGNFGFAFRYWFGRGRWAPTFEMTAALTFKFLGEKQVPGEGSKRVWERSPVGFTADVGFGLGGFGALVFGGQYNSPNAREDLPESLRLLTSGMVFFGFRGNLIWGAPAALAVTTHALAQSQVRGP